MKIEMIEFIEISTCETRSNKFWEWSAIGNFSTAPIQFMGVLDFQMETWLRKKTQLSLLMDLKTQSRVLLPKKLPEHLEKANQR